MTKSNAPFNNVWFLLFHHTIDEWMEYIKCMTKANALFNNVWFVSFHHTFGECVECIKCMAKSNAPFYNVWFVLFHHTIDEWMECIKLCQNQMHHLMMCGLCYFITHSANKWDLKTLNYLCNYLITYSTQQNSYCSHCAVTGQWRCGDYPLTY